MDGSLFSLYLSIAAGGLLLLWPVSSTRQEYKWGTITRGQYCDYETFRADCNPGEITVIESARYGHMEIGKCIEADLGHFGCYEDVSSILDSKCTAKRGCEIALADQTLRETQPCTRGLDLYLEASYWCVQAPTNPCSPLKAEPQERYISSTQIYNMDCPGASSITIEAVPGQHLMLSLINPGTDSAPSGLAYGLVIGELPDDEQVLRASGQETTVFDSTKSSKVSIVLDTQYRRHRFILAFKAVGCPDLSPPPATVFLRQGDGATVSCRDTPQSWQLTCRGVHWLGVIGNCSRKAAVVMESKMEVVETEVLLALPKDVVFLIIGCGTLFIALIVITTGYVTLKRAQLQRTDQICNAPLNYTTVQRRSILKQRPNSDYLTPTYPADGQEAQVYDFPLPEIPATETLQTRGTVKRNNEEDYTASLSSTSTDYTRRYFVLDKDYIAVNNMHNC